METGDVIRVIIFLGMLAMSAMFSGTEAAFLSIQRGRLAALARNEPEKARKVERFASNPEKLLSTVLTGNNLVNTAAAALGTSLALSYLPSSYAVVAATIGVTIVVLVFGEAIPKTVSTKHSVGVSVLMSGPLRVVESLLLPPIWILERLVRTISRMFGLPDSHPFSHEEIIALVDMGTETGAVAPVQAEMVGNVFRVEERHLKEIMTPRTEIIGIKKGTTLSEFYQVYCEHPHTRFPVYEDSLDHIVGVLSVKDIMQSIAQNRVQSSDDVTQLAAPPHLVPETRMLGTHLRELRDTGEQMFILADEYGGIAGLVTLKGTVEEIVGPLSAPSELDAEYETIDIDTYQVDGSLDINDANRELGLDVPEGDYETVAGFILSRLGVIPKVGDQVHYKDFVLEVTEMQGVKVEKVLVVRLPQEEIIVT